MRFPLRSSAALAGVILLSACGGTSLFNRERPDEMAVTRQPPLVIPPDFHLSPPAPGAPGLNQRSLEQQALEAMFGGTAQRSPGETSNLRQAGVAMADSGIRSSVGDSETQVVDKGRTTLDIIAAPEGDGQYARVAGGAGQ